MGYELIYRWRHSHPFTESIKMLNITEPHDQLLHLNFLFRMLSSLYMDLTPVLVTLQHVVMFRFISCPPELNKFSLISRVLTPISKRHTLLSVRRCKTSSLLSRPRISRTLILRSSCCDQPRHCCPSVSVRACFQRSGDQIP